MKVSLSIIATLFCLFPLARAVPAQTCPPVSGSLSDVLCPANQPSAVLTQLGGDWVTFASSPDRNAFVKTDAAGNPPLIANWNFAEDGALKLDALPLNGDLKTTAYTLGMPVGPSLSHGLVYAGSDNGYVYAVNAASGKIAWSHYLWNMAMANPLVVGDTVYVTTGNAYFNFGETLKFARGQRAVRGPGLNGLYALDRRTGHERWHFYTAGENMPTPTYANGTVFFASGDGNLYAVDASTEKLRWKSDVQSIDGMSAPVFAEGKLYFGGSHPDAFYALDAASGRIVWKELLRDPTLAGFGAATAAYAAGTIVVEELIRNKDPKAPTANLLVAMDSTSGKIVWQQVLGTGAAPGGFATATPAIVDGTVYISSIVDRRTHALSLSDGRSLWVTQVKGAGAGLVVGEKTIYVAAGPQVVALARRDGHQIGAYSVGGYIGPATPIIVGGTLLVTNLYGWMHAIPLSEFKSKNPESAATDKSPVH
ncbi:MAG: outer membrane protein assembly factor BamB family protein [Candidatus Binataceae bacterium]